jgi:hypothetical protein
MKLLKSCWCTLFHAKRRLWVYATGVQPFWHCDKCDMRTPSDLSFPYYFLDALFPLVLLTL